MTIARSQSAFEINATKSKPLSAKNNSTHKMKGNDMLQPSNIRRRFQRRGSSSQSMMLRALASTEDLQKIAVGPTPVGIRNESASSSTGDGCQS